MTTPADIPRLSQRECRKAIPFLLTYYATQAPTPACQRCLSVVRGYQRLLQTEGTLSPGPVWILSLYMARVQTPRRHQPFAPQRRRVGALSPAKRFAILKRDNYRCQLCGITAQEDAGITLQVDHKIARANGGTNDPSNLWTLCNVCNIGKGIHALSA